MVVYRKETGQVVEMGGALSYERYVHGKKSCAMGFDAVPAGVWVAFSELAREREKERYMIRP